MALPRTSISIALNGRYLATAFALSLGIVLVGTARAEAAGCGRHVVRGASLSAQLDALRDPAPGPTALPPERAPEPCSGPGCSDGGRPMPSPPGSTIPISPREWCTLNAPAFVPRSPASAVLTDDPAGRPTLMSARLERPPRPFA